MDLLIFAHRSEANAFLNTGNFKQVKENSDLWIGSISSEVKKSSLIYILVCGEGILNSMSKSAYILGSIAPKVSQIINYGVCGALREELTIGEIYPIKTVYGENQFHSFPIQEKGLDIITSWERVLSKEKRDELDNFAPLVDRETWSLAKVAKQTNKNFMAFKLVSDFATDNEICSFVKEQASLWSEKLLRHYLDLKNKNREDRKESAPHPFDTNIFHITLAQERKLNKLIHSLDLKNLSLNTTIIKEIEDSKLRSKDKTKKLIYYLSSLLNPLMTKQEEILNKLSHNLRKVGAQVHFTKDLEEPSFTINAHLKTDEDRNKVAQEILNFDHNLLRDYINGKDQNV